MFRQPNMDGSLIREILNAGTAKDFRKLEELLQTAKRKQIETPNIYDHALTAAADCGEFEYAIDIYIMMTQRKLATPMTYGRMIKVAARFEDLDWVNKVYEDAIEAGVVNAIITQSYISAANSFGRFDLVTLAYIQVVANNQADLGIFKLMIITAAFAASRNKSDAQKRDYAISWLHRAFADATEKGLSNDVDKSGRSLYQIYMKQLEYIANDWIKKIECAQAKQDFKELQELLEETRRLGIDTPKIYDYALTAAANCGKFDYAIDIYIQRTEAGLATPITYGRMIDAANNHNCFEWANQAFQDAYKANAVYIMTINKFISTANHFDRFDLAISAYNRAIKDGLDNQFTYNLMMNAAISNFNRYHAQVEFGIAAQIANKWVHQVFNDATKRGLANELVEAYTKHVRQIDQRAPSTIAVVNTSPDRAFFESKSQHPAARQKQDVSLDSEQRHDRGVAYRPGNSRW